MLKIRMINYFYLQLLIIFAVFNLGEVYGQGNRDFRVFDGLMIKDKPNLFLKSFSRINVIYEDSLTKYDSNYPKNLSKRIINNEKFNRSIKRANNNNYPICLDVESWPLYEKDLDINLKKYSSLLSQFKNKSLNKNIGYFGVLPYGNVYKNDSRFNDIGNISSIAYPVFYTKSENKKLWLNDVEKQLAIIKRNWPHLKVYAFIWPQYHTNNPKLKGKYISQEMWNFQLEELYKRCDGVVIWMPPFDYSNRKAINWDSSKPWYNTTLNFMKKRNIKGQ